MGEIAMKLCYFNNFQHFQILLLVTDRCSKVENPFREGKKEKTERKRSCLDLLVHLDLPK